MVLVVCKASLKGKLVEIQRGPATVNDCFFSIYATVIVWEGANKQ